MGGAPSDFRLSYQPKSTLACVIGAPLAFRGGRVLGLLSASNFFPAGTRVGCTGTAQPLRAVPGGSPRGASRAKEMRTFPVSGSLGVPRGRLGAPRGRKVEIALSLSVGNELAGRTPQTSSESGLAKAACALLLSESLFFPSRATRERDVHFCETVVS